MAKKISDKERAKNKEVKNAKNDFLPENIYNMSLAPKIGDTTNWFQMLPIAFFGAVIIMITRMANYERPMDQFFWSSDSNSLADFFSYYKMVAILTCTILVLIIILYRLFSQSFSIRKSFAYIPMIIYAVFVVLSYFFSDYKLFALWGWNERFEGTLTLLCYMVMLFYIINTVRSERDIKWVVYPLAIFSTLLCLLGVTQALDHDFFRTEIGKKLITPSWFWDKLETLNFTFQNKQIYQTVYNINYVSFYLTLLIPLFGMIFIQSVIRGSGEALWKKIIWGVIFALLVFNLIGSASSGGLLGLAFVIFIGAIVLNKRIIKWIKPILFLFIISILVAGISFNRWLPELSSAINGVIGTTTIDNAQQGAIVDESVAKTMDDSNIQHRVDYMVTSGQSIVVSFMGNELTFKTFANDPVAMQVIDTERKFLDLVPTNVSPIYRVDDPRFNRITVRPAVDEKNNYYIIIGTDGNEWPFMHTESGPKYFTGLGRLVDLQKVPAFGWKDNQSFGSGRGYIWSRTIPLLKQTLILGHGADTFCIYFPQDDYVGKYNSGSFTSTRDIVVDKPHNLYFGAILGTGGISMLALLALWGIYLAQSFLLYRKTTYDSFMSIVGAGIFFGISGFLVSAFVNDSSVSVMPMFYTLLGTGISINSILRANRIDS